MNQRLKFTGLFVTTFWSWCEGLWTSPRRKKAAERLPRRLSDSRPLLHLGGQSALSDRETVPNSANEGTSHLLPFPSHVYVQTALSITTLSHLFQGLKWRRRQRAVTGLLLTPHTAVHGWLWPYRKTGKPNTNPESESSGKTETEMVIVLCIPWLGDFFERESM